MPRLPADPSNPRKSTKSPRTVLRSSEATIHDLASGVTETLERNPTSVILPAQAVALSVDQTYEDLRKQALTRRLALTDIDTISELSPAQVLIVDIQRTHKVVNEMARRIAPMLDSLPDPSSLDKSAPDYLTQQRAMFDTFLMLTARGSKPHAFLELMLNFQKHLTNVAKSALDADIADRMANLAESDAMDMIEVMRNIFNDDSLELTIKQRQALPGIVRTHIQAYKNKRSRKAA